MISKKEIIEIINNRYNNVEEFTLLTILDAIKNQGLTTKEEILNMLDEADFIMSEINNNYNDKRNIQINDFYNEVKRLANKYNISYLLITDKRYDSNDLNNKTFSDVLDYYDSLKDSNE